MVAVARIAALGALLALVTDGGCYQPHPGRCQVTCAADRACPGGAACGTDGYCHASDDPAACAPLIDGPAPDGRDPDAPPASPAGATLAAGDGHACAIRDGRLWCWGDDRRGQLGADVGHRSATPVEVGPGLGSWAMVAAGARHTCGVRAGVVQCWGAGDAGQNGQTADTAVAQPVTRADLTPLAGIRGLCAGARHACAIVDDGARLACWGANYRGQRGDGTAMAGRFATDVVEPAGPGPWTALACGDDHTCALRGGRAYCWGDPAGGRLGRTAGATNVPDAPLAGLTAPTAIAAGAAFGCALDGGALRCWGDNDGSLGATPLPRAVPPLAGALTTISARHRGLCVGDGTATACLGIDGAGERGDGSFAYQNQFVAPVAGLGGALELASGAGFHCARTATDVRCWGRNGDGQLGGATHATGFVPRVVAGTWRAVAVGVDKTCAIDAADRVYCWGDNRRGQLVPGDARAVIDTPTEVTSATTATRLALATDHACAATTSGQVRCWGDNGFGRVGNGLATLGIYPGTPVAAGGQPLTTTTALAVSDHASCASALPTTGAPALWCWGDNAGFRIGGADPAMAYPTPVAIDTGAWLGLALGGDFGCGFRAVGSATACWGQGAEGQQGDGAGATHATPTAITGPPFVTLAAASRGAHACGVTAGGQLWCWGRNSNHQVRGADVAPVLAPTAIDAATDWAQVATGTATTCAIKTGGALYCWGRNGADTQEAGLDLDTGLDVTAPTLVGDGFTAIAVGDTHACGLAGSQLACWGASRFGAAGIAGAHDAAIPARVSLP